LRVTVFDGVENAGDVAHAILGSQQIPLEALKPKDEVGAQRFPAKALPPAIARRVVET